MSKNSFDQNGFSIEKINGIDNSFVSNLKNRVEKIFPDWESGFAKDFDLKNDKRFSENFIDNKIIYRGCSKENMYARGKGNSGRYDWENWLHGRKATLNFLDNQELFSTIINNKLFIDRIKDLLKAEEISFHEGLINAIYPGFQGTPNSYFCESPRFFPSLKLSNQNRLEGLFILRVDIDLSDSANICPTYYINKTHSEYSYLNHHFAKIFSLDSHLDSTLIDPYPHIENNQKKNMPNTIEEYEVRGIYSELFPNDLNEECRMEESLGSASFINTNLFLRQGCNQSQEKIKYFFSLYFSRFHHDIFRIYPKVKIGSDKIFNNIDNSPIFKKSFLNNRKNNSRKITSQIYKKILGGSLRIKEYINAKGRKEAPQQISKKISEKEYLNVGAGPMWRHPDCISLDFDPELSEVSFDLEKKVEFPFETDRFKGVYTSHNLEHLKNDSVVYVIEQIYRCLAPKGVLRITLPDILRFFDAYENKNVRFFDWIRAKDVYMYNSWLRLIVRSFAEPAVDDFTDSELYQIYRERTLIEFLEFFDHQVDNVKNKNLLTPDSHKSWHSVDKFFSIFEVAGFSSWQQVSQNESSCEFFKDVVFNQTRPHMSFFIEAIK